MGFLLFLLLNVILFVRPTELVPELENVRAYEFLTVLCLAVAAPGVAHQFSPRMLQDRPITLCLVGLLLAVMLSQLAHFSFWGARVGGYDFFKVLVYYLLLVVIVNTASRLRWFLLCLSGLITVVAMLALLQYHEIIDIPALSALEQPDFDAETGQLVTIPRLRGTGIFNDPNDLSLILALGILLCLYWLGSRPMGGIRYMWLGALALFIYGLIMTHSRGGLLAVSAGLLVLIRARYGWWQAIGLALCGFPLLLFAGGRQTRFALSDQNDTAQERVQIWAEGLGLFRREPLFGIGYNQFAEENSFGLVAHNSYIHSYVELGFLGGTFFVGAFVAAVLALRHRGATRTEGHNGELSRLRPYLMAMLAAYMVGMFGLSRCYVIPTYLVPGLVTAYLQVTSGSPGVVPLRVDGRLLSRLGLASAICLAFHYCFVRTFAQFG